MLFLNENFVSWKFKWKNLFLIWNKTSVVYGIVSYLKKSVPNNTACAFESIMVIEVVPDKGRNTTDKI
jgi:hypothetical protein